MKRAFLFAILVATITARAEKVGPWDLDALQSKVPAVKWLDQNAPVHSLLYTGEVYQGKETEVFAFYASPSTLDKKNQGGRFPGVVLIHGGGGTAFVDWAHLWAKRGYAAIAMDLSGSRPPEPVFDPKTGAPLGHQGDRSKRTRLPNGGPGQGNGDKFDTIGGDVGDDWPYHAVANVIRAHSLLRSLAEVDGERTAVTGISWGGYTTCLVASLDGRFKAAVPVYGCGYLHEGESVQKPSIDKLGERAALWVKEYDPGSLLGRCRVPLLFVNGTNDIHYVLDSYMKSYRVVPGEKQLRIQVKMPHSHPSGWAPEEIGWFIDSKCRKGDPLPAPGEVKVVNGRVEVSFNSFRKVTSAELNYTSDKGLRSKREWKKVPGVVSAGKVTVPAPPKDANTWFVNLFDDRGAMVSTEVMLTGE